MQAIKLTLSWLKSLELTQLIKSFPSNDYKSLTLILTRISICDSVYLFLEFGKKK